MYVSKTLLGSASMAFAALAGSVPLSAEDANPAGSIKCTLTVSVELAVGARRPVACVFQPTAANKPAVPLEVTINHYGADVRLIKQVDLSWTVNGSPKTSLSRLAGTYNGNLALARKTDPANALSAGGEFELVPVSHDNPDVFNLANGIATATVGLK
jgi:hypothetical protein